MRFGTATAVLAACTAAGGFSMSPALAAKSPQDFLKAAIQGDNAEIKLGQQAEAHASSNDVRNFGQTLVTDHTTAKKQATAAAGALNITPPDGVTPDADAEYNKLAKMTGNAYDRAFLNYAIEDHRKDIQEFEAQAKSHDKTSNLAQQQLPVLRKHLSIAQSLQARERASR